MPGCVGALVIQGAFPIRTRSRTSRLKAATPFGNLVAANLKEIHKNLLAVVAKSASVHH
jgi:hypothetical protein